MGREDSRLSLGSLETASDEAVLAALLSSDHGTAAAAQLIGHFGSLTRVLGASISSLASIDGVNRTMATAVCASRVLNERALREQIARRCLISSWSALLAYARVSLAGAAREQFRVLFLDKKNGLIADELMGNGTVDHAPIYPREVMRRALELDASALVMLHNHPSGDPTPSSADIDMTRQVVEAGRCLKISVHDHIVVGVAGVASFKALGLL